MATPLSIAGEKRQRTTEESCRLAGALTTRCQPNRSLALLCLKPGGCCNSRVRSALSDDLRAYMDSLGKDELKRDLRLMRNESSIAVFSNVRNGLFEGFFYVAAGAVLGMRHERLGRLPVAALVAATIFGVLGCLFVSNDAHLPFCAVTSVGVFLLSVRRHGTELKPHVASRNASTIIYLVHMFFVVAFVCGICCGTNPAMCDNEDNGLLLYLFALGGSGLISAAVIALANRVPVVKRVLGI